MWFALAGVFLSGCATAETYPQPRVSANDTWTYQYTAETRTAAWRQTRVENTVVRASANEIVLSNKTVGSSMPPNEGLVGADWSRMRSVNGRETVVNRPFAFPLAIGKSWEVDYTETPPANRAHSSEHWHSNFKVTGWEDVTVPAGTFHALKIEAEGSWTAVLAPAVSGASGARVDARGATTVIQTNRTTAAPYSGRSYKAFWYVPAVKRWVKADEEYYDSGGVRNEKYVSELVSYKVAE